MTVSRRQLLRSGGAAVGTLAVGGMSVPVVRGATQSGRPEILSQAVVPDTTSISLEVTEDTGQEKTTATFNIEDGESRQVADELQGTSGSIESYDITVTLSQDHPNDEKTPRLEAIIILLPTAGVDGRGVVQPLYASLASLAGALSYDSLYSRRLPTLSSTLATVMWSVVAIASFGIAAVDGGSVTLFQSRAAAFVAAGAAILSGLMALLSAFERLQDNNPDMKPSGGYGQEQRSD